MRYYPKGSPILGIGSVSPKSGESRYFNIYEVWSNSTVEVYKNEQGKFKFVCTAGESSLEKGTVQEFIQDQTRRYIGSWTLVDSMPIANFRTSGYPRASMFTYK